ncbi:MAG: carboxypeptidase-like regulatory domain-containing protein, partial [Candidatus Sericytochromatia bacterium]|nr:carboxypeptidase-like regulatory domain-containing protein [Candidatus Sericytochromatia bacterium]
MAFSRKQMAAAVAGTLSLSMLTGCPWGTPTATQSPAPAAATPAASPVAPVASPSAAAPIASPSTDATGTAAPSLPPAAPAASGEKVIVSGNVYDEKGATVDGATIIVKSLDKTAPYEFSTTTTQGSYVLNSVPEGANVEIIASKDGWTSRRRVGSFQKAATGKKNIIDFGTAGGST